MENCRIINFVSVNQRTNELTYSNMQIIAREVELQTMRRSAPKNSDNNPTTKTTKALQKPKPQNHLQRLNLKSAVAKTKDLVRFVVIIFFAREKKNKQDSQSHNIYNEIRREKNVHF